MRWNLIVMSPKDPAEQLGVGNNLTSLKAVQKAANFILQESGFGERVTLRHCQLCSSSAARQARKGTERMAGWLIITS
jgi:hypothetical protein